MQTLPMLLLLLLSERLEAWTPWVSITWASPIAMATGTTMKGENFWNILEKNLSWTTSQPQKTGSRGQVSLKNAYREVHSTTTTSISRQSCHYFKPEQGEKVKLPSGKWNATAKGAKQDWLASEEEGDDAHNGVDDGQDENDDDDDDGHSAAGVTSWFS